MFQPLYGRTVPKLFINSLISEQFHDIPSIQRLKQLYGVNVPELSEIDYF
ncbi:unnamed protein product [Staurois parvus]|uniref:Uncharacterized protein n=1 Tax=Staurois parvus TaxID=386267 RepID=A0ABN9G7C7_9NEOB|nr:unnamed protein product [Staurois parvus]